MPNYFNPYYNPYAQPNVTVPQPNTTFTQPASNTIQNGGIINVQSEQEARDYLVAQGTSVTFVNGNEQKIYIKTRGFSSLDKPTFETYRLVKEEGAEASKPTPVMDYVEKSEFEALKADFEALKKAVGDKDE